MDLDVRLIVPNCLCEHDMISNEFAHLINVRLLDKDRGFGA